MRKFLSQFDLEETLAGAGFITFMAGLTGLFGPMVALVVGGFIFFVLGIGLAIYKGAR